MVKLAEVAKAAGVSQGTVSNVFNRPELVRPEVRKRVEASARREGLDIVVELRGRAYTFRPRDSRAPKLARRRAGADLARGEVHAPMPGLVVEVLVQAGDPVEAGQPVVIVEAMKMQNELAAPIKGHVARVPVAPGAAVDAGQLLIAIEPEGA